MYLCVHIFLIVYKFSHRNDSSWNFLIILLTKQKRYLWHFSLSPHLITGMFSEPFFEINPVKLLSIIIDTTNIFQYKLWYRIWQCGTIILWSKNKKNQGFNCNICQLVLYFYLTSLGPAFCTIRSNLDFQL